jgi:hypothetical protein
MRCVAVSTSLDPAGVASAIRGELAKVPAGFNVAVDPMVDPARITLHNEAWGVSGNTAIVTFGDSVATASPPASASAAIVVDGMGGGRGCAIGSPCAVPGDCVSGHCRSGLCSSH